MSSGEPDRVLGGEVFALSGDHGWAVHEPGVEAPGLKAEASDWVLGSDLVRGPGDGVSKGDWGPSRREQQQ